MSIEKVEKNCRLKGDLWFKISNCASNFFEQHRRRKLNDECRTDFGPQILEAHCRESYRWTGSLLYNFRKYDMIITTVTLNFALSSIHSLLYKFIPTTAVMLKTPVKSLWQRRWLTKEYARWRNCASGICLAYWTLWRIMTFDRC